MEHYYDYLKELRNSRKLSIRALSQGLCSPSTYHAIESGESIPAPSLLKLLVERLGVSFNNFELIIDKKTYKQELLFSNISVLIETGKTKEAENLLKSIDPGKLSNSIDRMFYHRMTAWSKYARGDYEGSKTAIKSAIGETLSLKTESLQNLKAISSTEIENILFLLNLSIVAPNSKRRSVFLSDSVLDLIKEYLKSAKLDPDEYSVIYPKVWYIEAQMALMEGDEEKAVSLSVKAIRVLRKAEIYFLIPSFLDMIATHGKDILMSARYALYNGFNAYLHKLIGRAPISTYNRNHLLSRFCKTIYHLDYEVIRGERKRTCATQSAFVRNTYADESALSKIETGTHSIRTSKMDMIMNTCNLNKNRINMIPLHKEDEPVDALGPIKSIIGNRALFYDELLRVTDICQSMTENDRSDEAETILSDALTSYEESDLTPFFHFVPYESLRTFWAGITQSPVLAIENIKYSLIAGSLRGVVENYRIISSMILR